MQIKQANFFAGAFFPLLVFGLVGCRMPLAALPLGEYIVTNNPLDLAIDGEGFFELQQPNGQFAYTRDGRFFYDAQGRLVSNNGYQLVPTLTVPPGSQDFVIRRDGTAFARSPLQTEQSIIGSIKLVKFPMPSMLQPVLFHPYFTPTLLAGPAQRGEPTSVEGGFGAVIQGTLEVLDAQRQ